MRQALAEGNLFQMETSLCMLVKDRAQIHNVYTSLTSNLRLIFLSPSLAPSESI